MTDTSTEMTHVHQTERDPREAFTQLADRILSATHAHEQISLYFTGENTDFVRLSTGRIRQPGHVRQGFVSMRLAAAQRSAEVSSVISGDVDEDTARLSQLLDTLREQVSVLPEDPSFNFPARGYSDENEAPNRLPPTSEIVDDILDAAEGQDLVGLVSAGGVFAGFTSSSGGRSWFARHPVQVDFSLQLGGDKAVKGAFAGTTWDGRAFAAQCQRMKNELEIMRRDARRISPGAYRAYLAPAALDEIFQVLAWGGAFGFEAWNTKESCLIRLQDNQSNLSPLVEVLENTAEGFGPSFNSQGFAKPASVTLISEGRRSASLVSPRTASEYQVADTGAEPDEEPCALEVRAGDLADADILCRLGTGLYVSNLWYLNHSDRQNCRLTGMTRFGTFWVENGEIVAPLEVMRFDDTLFRMLGSELEALTQRRQRFMDTRSYGARSTKSSLLPGALLRSLSFTL